MSSVFKVKKEIPGKSFLRRVSRAAALLGVVAFWSGMALAARRYPSEYDWRFMPVSDLLSPGRNPGGYAWASMGIVLSSICGLCWTAEVTRHWKKEGAGSRPNRIRALQFGYLCMMCAVFLSPWLIKIRKGHEYLAVLAFAGLLIGTICLTFQSVSQTLLPRMGRFSGHARLYAAISASVSVFPILAAGLTQAYVHYVFPELPWVNLSWRARGVPVYLSFAFWEWVTCVILSVYMAVFSLAAYTAYPKRNTGEPNSPS